MNRLLFGIVCVVLGCSTRQPKHMASDATRGPSTAHDRANDRHCGLVAPAVLHEDGIGDLRIGRQVDSLRDRCDIVTDTTQLGEEALPERNIGVAIRGDIVNATIDSGRIWRIEVNSPGIRTADSLHVGSSLQQLLATGNAMGQEGE